MFLTISDMVEAVSDVIKNALGSSLLDIAVQVGATVILIFIVRRFFWNKILDFIEKRKQIMENELSSAKQANLEAQQLQEKADKKYQDIRSKSKGYLDQAKQKGEEERKVIVEKAKEEANNLLTQAEQEIALEKQKARADIQNEAVTLATLMASKIIKEELDDKKYQNLAVEDLEGSEKV
jgi:F-type H+-transporting ATPase subunit b